MTIAHAFFALSKAAKPFYAEEVREYFKEFERKCCLDYFEELEDM